MKNNRHGKKHPFAPQSKSYLEKLIQNKKVIIQYDVTKKDRYQRTLAYVYLHDGTFINEKLVKNGYAVTMTVPPNVKYSKHFSQLQQYAKKHHLGIWKNI